MKFEMPLCSMLGDEACQSWRLPRNLGERWVVRCKSASKYVRNVALLCGMYVTAVSFVRIGLPRKKRRGAVFSVV